MINLQINNLLFNLIKQNIPKEVLRENSIVEGEVISFEDGIVILNIDGEIVSAKTDVDVSKFLGEDLKFLIESKTGEKTVLKVITEENIEELTKTIDSTVDKVIKNFNLEKDERVENLISKFVSEKLPLTKENIEKGVKILDKIEDLISLDDEGLEILKQNSSKTLETKDIQGDEKTDQKLIQNEGKEAGLNKDIKTNDNFSNLEKTDMNKDTLVESEELISNSEKNIKILNEIINSEEFIEENINEDLDVDIKNILILKNNSIDSKDGMGIKDFIKKLDLKTDEEDLIEVTNFLVKNNIKPSLNNIKEILTIIKEPEVFIKELKEIFEAVEKEGFIDNLLKNTDKIKEKIDLKENNVDKLLESLDGNQKKTLVETKNKLEFIRDLNKEMYFHSIPLTYGEGLKGLINLVREKETKSGTKKPINIYINLNTNNLGNIKISCLSHNKTLSIKFGIEKEDEDLFRSLEAILVERLNELNYSMGQIDFVYEEKIELIKEVDKTDSIYFLDIKV